MFDRIGPYQVLDKLGAGGMGTVYRARHSETGKIVALKVMRLDIADDPTYLQRFRRESTIAESVQSPNIVSVLDVGQEHDTPYIAMELIEGESLLSLLRKSGPLPLAQSLDIAIQVAQGLYAAEQKGIIHRDISPQNVLMTPDGTAKIADFGIARSLGSGTLTGTGMFIGKPTYSAPETFEGQADARSDIYSLGVVSFEMLSGRPPFVGATPLATMDMQVRQPPPRLSDLGVIVPEAVEAILARCLKKNPDERFQSPRDLLHALTGALSSPVAQAAAGAGSGDSQTIAVAAGAGAGSPPVPPVAVSGPAGPGGHRFGLFAVLGGVAVAGILAAVVMVGAAAGGGSGGGGNLVRQSPLPAYVTEGTSSGLAPSPPGNPAPTQLSGSNASPLVGQPVGQPTSLPTQAPGQQPQTHPPVVTSAPIPIPQRPPTPVPPTQPTPVATPRAPSNLTVTALDPYTIRLDWTDNSDSEDGFEIADCVQPLNQSGCVIDQRVGPNVVSYVIGGFKPAEYKCFSMRSFNASGNSDWSPSYVCTSTQTQPPTVNHPPNPPRRTSPADGQVFQIDDQGQGMPSICWSDAGDPDGDPVTFKVTFATSQQSGIESPSINGNCYGDLNSLLDFMHAQGASSWSFGWHVRAIDSAGGNSDGSACWTNAVDCYGDTWWIGFTLVISHG